MNEAESICLDLQALKYSDFYYDCDQLFKDLKKLNDIISYYKFLRKKKIIIEEDFDFIEDEISDVSSYYINRISNIATRYHGDEATQITFKLIEGKKILSAVVVSIENNKSYFDCVLREIDESIRVLMGQGRIKTSYNFHDCRVVLEVGMFEYSVYQRDVFGYSYSSIYSTGRYARYARDISYKRINMLMFENNQLDIIYDQGKITITTNDSEDLQLFELAHWLKALIERESSVCIFKGDFKYKYRVPDYFSNSNNSVIKASVSNTSMGRTLEPYNTSTVKKEANKRGCFIATCVYGSYDCSQVWRLRRYRDNYLDRSFVGRLFIKVYYSISPKLVKLFGNKEWFRKPIKRILDRKIKKLERKGYEDTPYNDKY